MTLETPPPHRSPVLPASNDARSVEALERPDGGARTLARGGPLAALATRRPVNGTLDAPEMDGPPAPATRFATSLRSRSSAQVTDRLHQRLHGPRPMPTGFGHTFDPAAADRAFARFERALASATTRRAFFDGLHAAQQLRDDPIAVRPVSDHYVVGGEMNPAADIGSESHRSRALVGLAARLDLVDPSDWSATFDSMLAACGTAETTAHVLDALTQACARISFQPQAAQLLDQLREACAQSWMPPRLQAEVFAGQSQVARTIDPDRNVCEGLLHAISNDAESLLPALEASAIDPATPDNARTAHAWSMMKLVPTVQHYRRPETIQQCQDLVSTLPGPAQAPFLGTLTRTGMNALVYTPHLQAGMFMRSLQFAETLHADWQVGELAAELLRVFADHPGSRLHLLPFHEILNLSRSVRPGDDIPLDGKKMTAAMGRMEGDDLTEVVQDLVELVEERPGESRACALEIVSHAVGKPDSVGFASRLDLALRLLATISPADIGTNARVTPDRLRTRQYVQAAIARLDQVFQAGESTKIPRRWQRSKPVLGPDMRRRFNQHVQGLMNAPA